MEKIELRTVEKEKLRKFFKPLDKKKMIKIIVVKEMVQYKSIKLRIKVDKKDSW